MRLRVWTSGAFATRGSISTKTTASSFAVRDTNSAEKNCRGFLPWIRETLNIALDSKDIHRPSYPTTIPPYQLTPEFRAAIESFLSPTQIEYDGEIRMRHGHGHTQEEMFAIKYGQLGRIPDLVVFPETDQQVASLIEAAKTHNVTLIPYGGGTNVTDALRCHAHEKRTIVSVDMQRMNRILWIDKTNQMACIQAGAVGRHIMAELKKYGVTMGHEPDSVEFSTLGRLDCHQRQRHEKKPVRQHRRHCSGCDRRHRRRDAGTRIVRRRASPLGWICDS